MSKVMFSGDFHLFCMGVALTVGMGIGGLVGSSMQPQSTELQAAQQVAGREDVRLVGFRCGEQGATVLLREEDGFDLGYCKEIRLLNDQLS